MIRTATVLAFSFLSFALTSVMTSTASADTATYQKFALSRFKEDKGVRAAIAEVKAHGYVLDAEPTAAMLTSECTSQVCKPVFLVTLGATSVGGAFSHTTVVGAIIGATTHFGTEVIVLSTDKMAKLPELLRNLN